MQNLKKPVKSEQNIYLRNKKCSHVKVIGTCYLTLSNDFVLEVEMTFYVLSFSRNLISKLVPFGYSIKFLETFSLFYIFDCVGNYVLSNGFYCISLQNNVTYSLIHVRTCCYLCLNTHTHTLI